MVSALSRYFLFLAFTGIPENFCTICPLFYSARLFTVTLPRKDAKDLKESAADFQNIYRYNVCLCSSVVLADVLEHNCNPAGENELSSVVGFILA